jgi:hypothetical protein
MVADVHTEGNSLQVLEGRGDFDDDGVSSAREFHAGTNPRDPASNFRLFAAVQAAGLARRWSALPTHPYRVLQSEDLRSWHPLQVPIVAGGPKAALLDPDALAAKARFYRVQRV